MEVKDPVCGMTIDSEKATAKREADGRTYYFCSAACAGKFDKNPSKFTTKS